MNNKEQIDNLKKAVKSLLENLELKQFFMLDRLVTPQIIAILYWLLLLSAMVAGIGSILDGNFFRGIFMILAISIGGRIICEIMIVIFRINETLININSTESIAKNNPTKKSVAKENPTKEK